MRSITLLSCLAAIAVVVGCQNLFAAASPAPAAPSLRSERVLLRSHFLGGAILKGNREAARWSKMAATNTAYTELLSQTAQKLATTPFRSLRAGLPSGAKDHADLLAPLFADLYSAESWIEWRGTATTTEQLAVAVRLSDARAKAWSVALTSVATSWTGQAPQTDAAGWQMRLANAPTILGFARVGEWVVLGLGQDQLKLSADFQAKLKAKTQPFPADAASWLDLNADWPLIQPRLQLPLPFQAPEAHLWLSAEKEQLRIRGTAIPEQTMNWNPGAWETPTNVMRDPLISFTAMRGVSTLFNENSFLRGLGLPTPPAQLFLWAMDGPPFRTYAYAPYNDASNVVRQIAAGVTNRFNPELAKLRLGAVSLAPTNPVLFWQGLPFIGPYLTAGWTKPGNYLFAGIVPPTPAGDLPPKALLRQFEGRRDLALYDWEVTEPRLRQWRMMAQLFGPFARLPQINTNMAAVRWLSSVQHGLGETVTEISVAGPREVRLIRKAPMGFNAFELTYLTSWLESSNFPFSPFVAPSPFTRPAKPAGANTNAPTRR